MSQQMAAPSTITSKLTALLRLGLVSKNNVARAITVFKNPEKAMKSGANRMLVQDLLVDIIDRILNNKMLYNTIRQSLSKESAASSVSEGNNVADERAKTLFRSGLVKKKDIMLARRAISNHNNLKSMSAVGVYRDMMITMLDSMVKKITGNPVLFNAFKRTLGTEQVQDSFTSPNKESIVELFIDVDSMSIRENNKPINPVLWSQAKTLAKNKLPNCSVDCTEGWATKWYNENGGDWQSIEEGKNFFTFMDNLEELNTETLRNYTYASRDNAKELKSWGKKYGSSPKDKLKIKNREKGIAKANKKLGQNFIETTQTHTKDKPVLATGMKEWTEGESQKGVPEKAREISREINDRIKKEDEENTRRKGKYLKNILRKQNHSKLLNKKLGQNFIEMTQTPDRKLETKKEDQEISRRKAKHLKNLRKKQNYSKLMNKEARRVIDKLQSEFGYTYAEAVKAFQAVSIVTMHPMEL